MGTSVTTPCASCDCREEGAFCPELLAALRRTYAAQVPSMEDDS